MKENPIREYCTPEAATKMETLSAFSKLFHFKIGFNAPDTFKESEGSKIFKEVSEFVVKLRK